MPKGSDTEAKVVTAYIRGGHPYIGLVVIIARHVAFALATTIVALNIPNAPPKFIGGLIPFSH